MAEQNRSIAEHIRSDLGSGKRRQILIRKGERTIEGEETV